MMADKAQARQDGPGVIKVDSLASKYNELLASLTSNVEDPGARHAAVKVRKSREEFMSACNGLLDELVELKQHLAAQPASKHKQQQEHRQQQQQQQPLDQVDHMQVDGDQQPQDIAVVLMQQHGDFLKSNSRISAALAAAPTE